MDPRLAEGHMKNMGARLAEHPYDHMARPSDTITPLLHAVTETCFPHSGCAIYASPYDNIWTRKIRQYMDLKYNNKIYSTSTRFNE